MRSLIFITIFVSIVTLHGVQGAPCNGFGTASGMYCNCFSGYSPDYKQTNIANCGINGNDMSCTTMNPGDGPLITGNYAPTLLDENNPVKFQRDFLVIAFKQPITNDGWQRTTTEIKLYTGHSTAGAVGSASCRYPGAMWTKVASQDSCQDVYTLNMPWGQYDACGFQKVPTTSYLIYTSTVEFKYMVRDPNDNTIQREMTNLFHFNIRLARQKTLTASINLAVDSPSNAAVSTVVVRSSVYDLLARRTMIVFQTQTSWPYKIASPLNTPSSTGPILATPDTNVLVTPDYLTPDNCEQTPGSICTQQFAIMINSTTDNCMDVAKKYILDTQLVCADVSTCTPVAGPQVTITVDAFDCTPTIVNSTAFATNALISFSDATLSSPASDFETGDSSYWAFVVTDPRVTIDAVTLSSVKLFDVADDSIVDTVYSKASAINELTNVKDASNPSIVYPPGTPAVVSFALPLNRAVLSNTLGSLAPGDAAATLSLEVVADIVYHGNQRKRLVGYVRPHNNNQAASISSLVVRSPVKGEATASVKQSDASQAKAMCTDSNSLSCAALSLVWKALGYVGL